MIVLVAALAVALVAAWVAAPLLRRRAEPEGAQEDAAWNDLLEAKQAVYRSILDLELDRATGKISQANFAHLRSQHEAEALAILKQMDRLRSSGADAADLLEREISAARERLRRS